jgi:hypothetical protein
MSSRSGNARGHRSWTRSIIVLVVGLALLAAGVTYIALPLDAIALPGSHPGDPSHNMPAGFFCLVAALACLIFAALLAPRPGPDVAPLRLTPRLREEDLPPGSIHVIPARPLGPTDR